MEWTRQELKSDWNKWTGHDLAPNVLETMFSYPKLDWLRAVIALRKKFDWQLWGHTRQEKYVLACLANAAEETKPLSTITI